jgi:spermidine synthase
MTDTLLYETDTSHNHYQVWDMNYDGRLARVLYSGKRQAAQSGIAYDGNSDLLFDYNQRLYELVSAVLPARLLLIGGGMFTLPTALLAALPSIKIDVIELDSGLDAIAEAFFDLKPNARLRIIHGDGREYLDSNMTPYDMILIDAFSHTTTPHSLTSNDAAAACRKNLRGNGIVAVNIISAYYGRGAKIISEQVNAYETSFDRVDIFPASHEYSLWLPQNLVLIAQIGKSRPVEEYVRYAPLGKTDSV